MAKLLPIPTWLTLKTLEKLTTPNLFAQIKKLPRIHNG